VLAPATAQHANETHYESLLLNIEMRVYASLKDLDLTCAIRLLNQTRPGLLIKPQNQLVKGKYSFIL
jgi:hypothetical protein